MTSPTRFTQDSTTPIDIIIYNKPSDFKLSVVRCPFSDHSIVMVACDFESIKPINEPLQARKLTEPTMT